MSNKIKLFDTFTSLQIELTPAGKWIWDDDRKKKALDAKRKDYLPLDKYPNDNMFRHKIEDSGYLCIDCDGIELSKVDKMFPTSKNTFYTTTSSKNKQHRYLAPPEGKTFPLGRAVKILDPDMDVFTSGVVFEGHDIGGAKSECTLNNSDILRCTEKEYQLICDNIQKDKPVSKKAKVHQKKKNTKTLTDSSDNEFITTFNNDHDTREMLIEQGYIESNDRLIAPSSTSGVAGVIFFDDNAVYSHHSVDDWLADGSSHDAFDIYAHYEFNGDKKQAYASLVEDSRCSLDDVRAMIAEVEDFSGDTLNKILKATGTLGSNIDIDIVLNQIKKDAKEAGTTVNISAMRKELTKVTKRDTPLDTLSDSILALKMVRIGAKALVMDSYSELTPPNELLKLYTGSQRDGLQTWIDHPDRRFYSGLVFDPSKNQEVVGNKVNLWTGYSLHPKKGNADKFLYLLEKVICSGDKEEYKYLKGYVAHQFQNPADKAGVAVVLKGEKGTGKDTFIDSLGKLYDDGFMPVSTKDQLLGRFNYHLANKIMISVPEMLFAGSHKEDSALKTLITATEMGYERKGVDVIRLDSFFRIYMTTNEDWAIPATKGERRYFLPTISTKHRKDTKFFGDFWDWYNNGGNAEILHWAMNYDISNFNVREVPHTLAMEEQILYGLDHFTTTLIDMIIYHEENRQGEVEITGSDVADGMNEGGTYYKSNSTAIGRKLSKVFKTIYKKRLGTQRGYKISVKEAKKALIEYTGVSDLFENSTKNTKKCCKSTKKWSKN